MRDGSLFVLAFAVLLAVPFVLDSFTAYQLGLYILYGMVGQGIALCWGRAGFLPLGQALFFGIGAYLAGAVLRTDAGWLLIVPAIAVATLVPALLAGLVGALVFNRQIGSGPYFSLITLALAMLGFQLANSMVGLTGGFNGMTGISGLPGIDTYETLYFVIIAVFCGVSLLLAHLLRAPFGQLLGAIRDNEERLQFFGFNTGLMKALAFAISGGVAGLAGALYAPHQGIVTPQAVGFLLSAELVIWSAVGGRASLAGPVIGAVLIGFLAAGLRDTFRYWEVVVALVFIVVVLRLPNGLVGLAEAALHSIGVKWGRTVQAARTDDLPARARTGTPDLEFRHVRSSAGPVTILDDLDFRIERPGIHCIIGPNGAGKTSALNAMTGRLPVSGGDIAWHGVSLAGIRPYRAATLNIGRKFQIPSVFPELTVGQNIDIALWANRLTIAGQFSMAPYRWKTPLLSELEARFSFLKHQQVPAGSLSVGQRQILDFAMTFLAEPDLVLLDEPCAGLSASETAEMIDAIAALNTRLKATSIIIEHDMAVVEQLSDHVIVMNNGRVLANGTMDEVRNNPEVRLVYAGGTK